MIVAAAAYSMDDLASWEVYTAKLERWVSEAQGDLLLFPEYGAMEIATITEQAGDLQRSIDAVTELLPDVNALHADLAAKYDCHILSASAPERLGTKTVNRARLFAPSGASEICDKQIMTRFERESWGISPGEPLSVVETSIGRVAVLICYDAEFPLLARAAVEAGAELFLVPSCTDTHHGWNRVRIGATARALEGQCITVQAPTVGACPWSSAVDENFGTAGIFAPPDLGFPADGVMAQGALDVPGWTRAEIDLSKLSQVRRSGAQFNHRHWPDQVPRATARHVRLR